MKQKLVNRTLALFASAAMLLSTVQFTPVHAESDTTPAPTETPAATAEPSAEPTASAQTVQAPAAAENTVEPTEPAATEEPAETPATADPEASASASPETEMSAKADTGSAAQLLDLSLTNLPKEQVFIFSAVQYDYTVTVPIETDQTVIKYVKEDATDSIYLNGGTTPVATGDSSSQTIYLAPGENTLSVRVQNANKTKENTYTIHVTRETKGTLSDLHLNEGDAFQFYPHVQYYSVTVDSTVSSVQMFYTKANADDTVKINGSDTDAGGDTSSAPLELKYGYNPLSIEVDSRDGTLNTTYHVDVFREYQDRGDLSDLHLSDGAPFEFSAGNKDYYVNVPYSTDAITVYYKTLSKTDKVSLNGGSFFTNGDTSSKPVYLQTGMNTLSVSVKSSDGVYSTTYNIYVKRGSSSTAELDDIKVNGKSIGVAAGQYDYTVEATAGVALITAVTAATDESITIDGYSVDPAAGYSKVLVPDDASVNKAIISTTSGDGTKTRTYTLNFVYSYQVTSMKFNASSVWIDSTKTDQTLDVSHYLAFSPNYSSVSLDWSSSDEKVATVDKNGVVTAVGTGTAKITASHQNMLNGAVTSTISASMNVTVSPLADTDKLVLELTGYATGGETGDTYPVKLYRASDRTSIPLSGVQIKTTNAAVADYDGTSLVAIKGAGSASITASLAIGTKTLTSAAVAVKGIAAQIHTVAIAPVDLDAAVFTASYNDTEKTNLAEVDADDTSKITFGKTGFTVKASLKDKQGAEIASAPAVKWMSSDATIASVKLDAEKNAVVTILKEGEVTITVQAQDQLKASGSFRLVIKNYAPTVESNTYTINKYSVAGAPVVIHQAYDNSVKSITVTDRKSGAEMPQFTVNSDNDIVIADGQELANASYNAQLSVKTLNGQTYQFPIVIKVISKAPAATVRLSQYVNSFIKDTETYYALAAIDGKGDTISNVTMNSSAQDAAGDADPYFTIAPESPESWAHAYIKPTENFYEHSTERNANVKYLHITFSGYVDGHNQATVKVTVPVKSLKPGLKLSKTSATVYQDGTTGDKNITVQLIDTTTGAVIDDLSKYSLAFSGAASNAAISGSGSSSGITVTSNGKAGTVNLILSNTGWNGTITLPLKISISSNVPVLTFSTTSVRFNQQFLNEGHPEIQAIKVDEKSNTANLRLLYVETQSVNADQTAGLFVFYYDYDAGTFNVAERSAGKGIYKYQVIPHFYDDDTRQVINGKAVTLTITVVDQPYSATAVAKNAINPVNSASFTEVLLRMTNINASVSDVILNDDHFNIALTDGKIYVSLKPGVSVSNQVYTINPEFHFSNGAVLYVPLKVTVRQTLPTVKAVPATMFIYNRFNTADRKIGDFSLQFSTFAGGVSAAVKSVEPLYSETLQNTFDYTYDTATGKLSISIKDASLIKAGSSSTLKFRVRYAGEVPNSTAYGTFTVRLTDKSTVNRAK